MKKCRNCGKAIYFFTNNGVTMPFDDRCCLDLHECKKGERE